jgi:hypothetical protein
LVFNPTLFAAVLVAVLPLLLVVRLLARRAHRRAGSWAQSSRRFSAETQVLLRGDGPDKGGRGRGLGAANGNRACAGSRGALPGIRASPRRQRCCRKLGGRGGRVGGADRRCDRRGGPLDDTRGPALLLRGAGAVAASAPRRRVAVEHRAGRVAVPPAPRGGPRDREEEPYARGGRTLELRGEIALAGVGFAFDESPSCATSA